MTSKDGNSDARSQGATGLDPFLPPEDQLAAWMRHLEELREATVRRVAATLWEEVAPRAHAPRITPEALCQSIRAHLRPVFIDDLLPKWGSWTGSDAATSHIRETPWLDVALEQMPSALVVHAPDPAPGLPEVDPVRWFLVSLAGGITGIVLIGTGGSIGAELGGVLGAAGAVAGVTYLSRNQAVRARIASGQAGDAADRPRTFSFRNKNLLSSIAKWPLQKGANVAIDLAARLVRSLLPTDGEDGGIARSEIAPAVEREFDAMATLAFMLCLAAQPKRSDNFERDSGLQVAESGVQRALTVLVRYLDKDPEDLETIRDMAQELQQRLQDAGYAWEVIPDGEPFREELLQAFRPFGLIEPGQPVQTLEPSFSRDGVVINPGTIARLRG